MKAKGIVLLSLGLFLIIPKNTAVHGIQLVIACGAVGKSLEICRKGAEEWAKARQAQVKVIPTPNNSNDQLSFFQLLLAARSTDVDLFVIDTTWPGSLGNYFVDLYPAVSQEEIRSFFPAFIQNNFVQGRLVAIPWNMDVGMLYYRSDLLEEYHQEVPQTWPMLGEVALNLQENERKKGRKHFWGYVFQGRAYEGLTCNSLEWISSFQKDTLFGAEAIDIFRLVDSWIGKIAPPGVLNSMEEETRGIFQSGNALFMRNWPYVYALANSSGSSVRGKVGVAPLPGNNGILGGASIAVSKYSKSVREGIELALHLTSFEMQKKRALELGFTPALKTVFEDPIVLTARPEFKDFLPIFENASARPAGQFKRRYNRASASIWNSVHKILAEPTDIEHEVKSLNENLRKLIATEIP